MLEMNPFTMQSFIYEKWSNSFGYDTISTTYLYPLLVIGWLVGCRGRKLSIAAWKSFWSNEKPKAKPRAGEKLIKLDEKICEQPQKTQII